MLSSGTASPRQLDRQNRLNPSNFSNLQRTTSLQLRGQLAVRHGKSFTTKLVVCLYPHHLAFRVEPPSRQGSVQRRQRNLQLYADPGRWAGGAYDVNADGADIASNPGSLPTVTIRFVPPKNHGRSQAVTVVFSKLRSRYGPTVLTDCCMGQGSTPGTDVRVRAPREAHKWWYLSLEDHPVLGPVPQCV